MVMSRPRRHASASAEVTRKRRTCMTSKMIRRALVLLFGMAVLIPAGPALAQTAPSNDDFNNATVVSALPFTDNIDTTGATAAADDPENCFQSNASVWYSFTPSQ